GPRGPRRAAPAAGPRTATTSRADGPVSRRHAEFRRETGTFSVHDVGSLNGTYVNRERIDSAALAGGDEVQIGKFRLVFLVGSHQPGGAADGVTAGEAGS